MKLDDIVPVVVLVAPTVIAAGVFWWCRGRERVPSGRWAAGGMALIVALLGICVVVGATEDKRLHAVVLATMIVSAVPWVLLRLQAPAKLLLLLAALIAGAFTLCAAVAGLLTAFIGSIAESGLSHGGGPGAVIVLVPAIAFVALGVRTTSTVLYVVKN